MTRSDPRTPDWESTAPSLDDFSRIAEAAFEALPPPLKARCRGVLVRIEDFASEEVLDALEIDDPFELTGLYQGVDLTQRSNFDPAPEPDIVFLYRRPILDEWCERGDIGLADLVIHVLIHEIGHHFGFSDADMDALQGGEDESFRR